MVLKQTLLVLGEFVTVFIFGWFLRHTVTVAATAGLTILGTLCVMALWYLYPRVIGKNKPGWQKAVLILGDVLILAIIGVLFK